MPDENKSEERDLKDREYCDKQGNIHHHTHEYEERKGDERGKESSNRESDRHRESDRQR